MNLEMLDGFFAALICSPDLVPPSEYLRDIWDGDRIGGEGFRDEAEMQEFFDLIMRHWNSPGAHIQLKRTVHAVSFGG